MIINIRAHPYGRCELCGAIDELRPYGLNHEEICYDCGKKDVTVTEMRMKDSLLFENDHIDDNNRK